MCDNRLEFVLDVAKERTGTDYYEKLFNMLDKALKEHSACCDEWSAYGFVWYTVCCYNLEQVETISQVVEDTFSTWKNKYKIDNMRDKE